MRFVFFLGRVLTHPPALPASLRFMSCTLILQESRIKSCTTVIKMPPAKMNLLFTVLPRDWSSLCPHQLLSCLWRDPGCSLHGGLLLPFCEDLLGKHHVHTTETAFLWHAPSSSYLQVKEMGPEGEGSLPPLFALLPQPFPGWKPQSRARAIPSAAQRPWRAPLLCRRQRRALLSPHNGHLE